jgi:hypothetical protein
MEKIIGKFLNLLKISTIKLFLLVIILPFHLYQKNHQAHSSGLEDFKVFSLKSGNFKVRIFNFLFD